MAEWNDQFAKLPVSLASTTGVRCEREDSHRSLQRVAEPQDAHLVRRVARERSLDDVFFVALDVVLERDGRNDPVPVVHPAVRLFRAATASRMRCCAPVARCPMPARKSSAVSSPTPLSALRNAFCRENFHSSTLPGRAQGCCRGQRRHQLPEPRARLAGGHVGLVDVLEQHHAGPLRGQPHQRRILHREVDVRTRRAGLRSTCRPERARSSSALRRSRQRRASTAGPRA